MKNYKDKMEDGVEIIYNATGGKLHWRYQDNPSIKAIHRWLGRHFGKADHCENITCDESSQTYDWALIKGKDYKRLRSHFMQLCRSCHMKYDMETIKMKRKKKEVPE